MIGIYKIQNIINNKVYIGQSVDIELRWKEHLYALSKNIHENKHLQNAWNKYGESNFTFTIVEECEEENLTEKEQYYIDLYGGINSESNYNNRNAGYKGSLSENTKQKLREINLGKTPWNKGLDKSDERVKKYSDNLKKQVIPENQKQKIRETVKKLHKEGRYNYSEITKKRLNTLEQNRMLGKARKQRKDKGIIKDKQVGKHISNAKKIANAQKLKEQGFVHSEETRKKISESVFNNSYARGKIWVHNSEHNIRIEFEQLNIYLENGYSRGMKK